MSKQLKSGNALVRLLLAHGEKLAMLGIAACVGLLVWSSLGREHLAKEHLPEPIKTSARQASEHVAQMSWEEFPDEEKPIADNTNIKDSVSVTEAVKPAAFPPYTHSWNPRPLSPAMSRQDPVLLAPIELETTAGSGLWASADPEEIKRRELEMIEEERRERLEKEREAEDRARETARNSRGRGGDFGGGEYGGAGGGEYGGRGSNSQLPKMDAKVERPRGGSQLQGFETVRETSWVTVLARVPIQSQHQLYRDALANARGYVEKRDMPQYFAYFVERAEIIDGKQGEWVQIDQMKESKLRNIQAEWPRSTRPPEVADRKVLHPLLSFPLPPMVVREWAKDVSHSEMPLASEIQPEIPTTEDPTEDGSEDGEGDSEETFFSTPDRKKHRNASPYGGGEYGGGGGEYGGGGGEYGGGEYGGGGEFGGGGGEYGGGGGEYGGGGGGGIYQAGGGDYTWDGETSHLLFRYFDKTVKAGHRYKYRVRLVLYDVNHEVHERHLDESVSVRRKELSDRLRVFRFTEWSEPSPAVNVPLPGLIYLVEGKEAKEANFSAQPQLRMMVKSLDDQYAAEVAHDDWYVRGSVINAFDKATVIWASRFQLEDGEKEPQFSFYTGVTLVDFYGGEKLPSKKKDFNAPTYALLMDASGRLTRREEMAEIVTVEDYQVILESESSTSGGGGGGEYGGGEFGGGEYGGGGEF